MQYVACTFIDGKLNHLFAPDIAQRAEERLTIDISIEYIPNYLTCVVQGSVTFCK
jgi:hypothetical protein